MTTVYIAALTFLIVLALGLLAFLSRCRCDRHPGYLPDDVYRRRRT